MNYYDQLVHAYTFNNVGLRAISAITFAFGFWEYIYSFRIALREKKSPFPLWMHTFYVAHDSSFAGFVPEFQLLSSFGTGLNWSAFTSPSGMSVKRSSVITFTVPSASPRHGF